MVRVTRKFLLDNRTPGGSWNHNQLKLLGVECPPTVGWMDRVEGKEITEEQAELFVKFRIKAKQRLQGIAQSPTIAKCEKCGSTRVKLAVFTRKGTETICYPECRDCRHLDAGVTYEEAKRLKKGGLLLFIEEC